MSDVILETTSSEVILETTGSEVTLEVVDEGQVEVVELLVQGQMGPQGPIGPAGPSHFADLLDVNVAAKVNNSVLYYNQTSAKFVADDVNTVVTLTDGGNF